MRPRVSSRQKRKQITLTISQEAYDATEELREIMGLSVSEIVSQHLVDTLKQYHEQRAAKEKKDEAKNKGTAGKRRKNREEREKERIAAFLEPQKKKLEEATQAANAAAADAQRAASEARTPSYKPDYPSSPREYDGYNINPYTGSIDPLDD